MSKATPAALHDSTIGFVGGGNMASALIGGLIERGVTATQIRVVDPEPAAAERLSARFGVSCTQVIDASFGEPDIVVLAVKPQQVRAACGALAAHAPRAVLLSIAAGMRTADMARWLPPGMAIVRSMPNTPALIGRGITVLYAANGVAPGQRASSEALMSAVGRALWVENEALLDVVTAVSGSGPAYFFYFMEAMERAARELGLDAADARALALETCAGAAALALDADESLATLRERVTSKGGTTYAALEILRAHAVGEAIEAAVKAAALRSRELGDEFGRD